MKIEIDVEIPEGYRFVRYDFVKPGEQFVNNAGALRIWKKDSPCKVKFVIIEREYREPSIPGEPCECLRNGIWQNKFYVGKTKNGMFVAENGYGDISWGYTKARVILGKPEYREATADDIGRQAEFSDEEDFGRHKTQGTLSAVGSGEFRYLKDENLTAWRFCRIKT